MQASQGGSEDPRRLCLEKAQHGVKTQGGAWGMTLVRAEAWRDPLFCTCGESKRAHPGSKMLCDTGCGSKDSQNEGRGRQERKYCEV